MYGNLEKLFDLEPQMFSHDEDSCGSVSGGAESKEGIVRCAVVIRCREELNVLLL
jgi:hypothetical protein